MATAPEAAVRNYLVALKDPSALLDEDRIADLKKRLEESDDQLERLRLRQELDDAQRPSVEHYENEFVTHAKAWADDQGISASAFAAEGVPEGVLRKAGLKRGGRARSAGRRGPGKTQRVTAEEVRTAIPRGKFTIKDLQERSGGSIATVRNVVKEAEQSGLIAAEGPDPDHSGPGRSPTVYRRA